MNIRLSTVRFDGRGHLDCRKCSRRTGFPDGAWLVIFDYGATQIVQSAHTKAVLHRCGQEFFWACDGCGEELGITLLASHFKQRRGLPPDALPCTCGGRFTQRRTEVIGVPEPEPVPSTPF